MYLEKFKSGKNTYIRLVECYRDPNTKTNRKKVIKNYGNYEKLKEQSPEVLRELEEKYSNVKAKEALARNDNFERLVNSLSAGVGDSEESLLLNYSSLILNPLWRDSLGMTEFFRYLKTRNDTEIQFDASKLTCYLAVQKMVEPQSHFHAYSSLSSYIGTGITELELSSLYRCLDYLYANKESILAHINRKVEGLYPRQNSLLFYDTTNCYFETPLDDEQTFTRYAKQDFCELLRDEGYEVAPDEVNALLEKEPSLIEIYEKCREEYGEAIRMRGLSKELSYDLPMVSVALVIDSNGFPVDFMVFAGNKSEKTNMVNSIDRLKSTYNITESIIVADSGLNSVPNMYMLLKNGFGYALSKSALSLPKKMEADITDLSKYTEKTDAQGNTLNYMYRIIDYPQKYKIIDEEHPENSPVTVVIQNKMLLTFSKKRQQHDLAVLEEKF
ncbi:MAG: IS1634 family transposase, partial [Succinivibrio dextrinosolvens]|nr:IS1634 family transposase [Succinivibrio dextrinosolvens]